MDVTLSGHNEVLRVDLDKPASLLRELAVAASEPLVHLAKSVDTLPRRRRRAFRLHKLEGYSQAETALVMGITVSAVEKHIVSALNRLLEKVQ